MKTRMLCTDCFETSPPQTLLPGSDRLEWLGVFADEPVPEGSESCADLLVERLEKRLQYAPGERDMLVMHHRLEYADIHGREHVLRSSMTEYGGGNGASAMSRTVGLPAACAARRILDGTIRVTGVRTREGRWRSARRAISMSRDTVNGWRPAPT